MSDTWTPDNTKTLTTMWAEGATATEIAHRIGGVTRSSVLGKLHRMKIASRPKRPPARNAVALPKIRTALLRPPAPPAATYSPKSGAWEPIPGTTPIPREHKNTAGKCQWPLGDPVAFFCGCERREGSSYCPSHHARAHNSVARTDIEAAA